MRLVAFILESGDWVVLCDDDGRGFLWWGEAALSLFEMGPSGYCVHAVEGKGVFMNNIKGENACVSE